MRRLPTTLRHEEAAEHPGGSLTTRFRCLLAAASLVVAGAACGGSGHRAGPAPTVAPTTVPPPTTTTTTDALPSAQDRGPRTVLSPIGLHVRAGPAHSAKILGTAAQGTNLTVIGNNASGWIEVKGATVTGWISNDAALSAPGTFDPYVSPTNTFGALYPSSWTYVASPPASVVFRAGTGPDTIVVTTAAKMAKLGPGRPGYALVRSEQIVVCGVTASLATYRASGFRTGTTFDGVASQGYLAQVLIRLNARHALRINANLTSPSALPTVRNFANSMTFPFPQCEG